MRIQSGINTPSQGKKQEAKSDYPFFVIVHASIDQAIANPSVFQDIKAEFLNNQFYELSEAKDEVISRVNQFRDADSNYLPSFFIWQALCAKFSSYIKNSNFLNNDPSPIKSMGVQDQWQFEPQTNGFNSVPFQVQSDGVDRPADPRSGNALETNAHYERTFMQQGIQEAPSEEVNSQTTTSEPLAQHPLDQLPRVSLDPLTNPAPEHPLMKYMRCPLSKELFSIPYITPQGDTYNYEPLKEHVESAGTHPRLDEALRLEECQPNTSLRFIIEHFLDVSEGRSRLLLCPYSRLPLQTPVLINPLNESGQALLSILNNDDTNRFYETVSYSKLSVMAQKSTLRKLDPNIRLTPHGLIPNITLIRFLKALTATRR